VGLTRRVFRAGKPVVGPTGTILPAKDGEAVAERSAHEQPVPALARFDERIQIGPIDEDPSQRFSWTVALARPQRGQVDDGDQS
jgi:hypothetical protein